MLEIACFTPSSALTAARCNASRIEFCADAAAGGVTPDRDALAALREQSKSSSSGQLPPIYVMIRPRGGGFVYTDLEFGQMEDDVDRFYGLADGFVFGLLTHDGKVDSDRSAALVRRARGKPCTFHRAFDELAASAAAATDKNKEGSLREAVQAIVACGFKAILTSGGRPTALDGANVIRELQDQFIGQISFIAGGKVRSGTMEELKAKVGPRVEWFHSAATIKGDEANEEEVRALVKYTV